jgi:hypothetical protein
MGWTSVVPSSPSDSHLRFVTFATFRLLSSPLALAGFSFMHYDLGYFDDETCRLEPIENPFGPNVLPIVFVDPRLQSEQDRQCDGRYV